MRWHAYQVIIILVPVTLLLLPLVSTEEWLLQGTGHPTSLPLDTALGAELVLKSLRRSGDCKALRFDSAKLWFMQKRGECFFAHFVNLYQICPEQHRREFFHFPSVVSSQRIVWETCASVQPWAALRLMAPFQHQGFLPGLGLSTVLSLPLGKVPSRKNFSCVQLCVTLRTVAPLSMGFSRQEYWSALTSSRRSSRARDQTQVS